MRNPIRWTMNLMMISAALGCGAGSSELSSDPTAAAETVAERPRVQKSGPHPRATLPDGFGVRLDLAISPEEVAQGLMYRPSLPAGRGMLFLFEDARMPSFWMKNTLIPLDIIYLDAHGVVVDIAHDAQPCKLEPCPQYVAKEVSLAVLELAAGTARAHDVVEGAQITFKRVPDYPKPQTSE